MNTLPKGSFWTELKNRWAKDSPLFFQKIQQWSTALLTLATGLIAIPAALNGMGATEIDLSLMVRISSYVFVAASVAKLVAGTTVKDPNYKTLNKPE